MQDTPQPARLRIVFFGTAELACASLAAIARDPTFHLVAVVTQPDRPQGRALELQPSPVKKLAAQLDLPVWQPERCRAPAFLEQFLAAAPDLAVVAAYGQLLPPALLEGPRYGCLNVHASLLPKYRGAAPIQWAILNGDPETGVTIMRMDAGLDTGGMLAQEKTRILPEDDARTLHERLAQLGAGLLVRTIPRYVTGQTTPQPQPAEGVSHARKITKEDGRLDWSRAAEELERRVRAFTPWPGAFTFLPAADKPLLLKIWRSALGLPSLGGRPGQVLSADKAGVVVACGSGALRIIEIQREGGRRLAAADFLAGHPIPVRLVLG